MILKTCHYCGGLVIFGDQCVAHAVPTCEKFQELVDKVPPSAVEQTTIAGYHERAKARALAKMN